MLEFFKLLNAGCEDHARLISLSLDHSLPRSQRFAVKLHLLYCRACRKFRRDAHLMRESIKLGCDESSEFPQTTGAALSPQAADKIAASLKARISNDQ
ncbi:MAG: hypothetical protein DHS20C16_16440 [Phycisphaerae bacterium]|nr:MAG: hypothetical protein DHS20C16_16440 [Phycisphaerae bacterium]